MSHIKELRALKKQIVATRAEMNELWNQRGHTDAEVLAASVQLDQLLNRYHQLTHLKKVRRLVSD